MKEKFTPGPWNKYPNGKRKNYTEIFSDQVPIVRVCSVYGVKGEGAANASLISTAPQMFGYISGSCEMCKKMKIDISMRDGLDENSAIENLKKKCQDCDIGKLIKQARGES